MDELKAKVLQKVKGDVLAADIVWSLFHSALQSYRHDSVLRPFPADYSEGEGEKDFKALTAVSEEIPNLKMLIKTSSSTNNKTLSEQAWKLLSWAVEDKSFTIKSLDKNRFDRIQELTGQSSYKVKPTHVFEVQYQSAANNRFDQLSQDKDIMYAYHGSRLENFHSILHNGLHSHMSKKPLFGEGTYLSSDLSVSMPYSPIGKAWDHSLMGGKLSCVAVCELIDHPDVKCSTKAKGESTGSQAPDSLGGDVPEKYYVVTNNEVVRVKYLLIFADNLSRKRSTQQRSKVMTFICSHLFALGILGYLLVLLFIGLLKSRIFQSFYRKYMGYS
ncbi:protein mono-ADP-ribosyltransferase PARP16-like [Amphiura filiformis]|uniref:protein mono-ADP-ribosyltransferase PARP16-like n=1 Tax=Amphiura filiformis TaxID=82378 RepID=UPI003B21C3E3